MLEMSVQYYRRSQLQKLSLDGKLRTLSRLLRQNLPMAMQGVGAVIPIYAAFDERDELGKIFFYDLLGATFESVDFCTTGSGSSIIRGALYYLNRWGGTPLAEMDENAALETRCENARNGRGIRYSHGWISSECPYLPHGDEVDANGIHCVGEDELEAIFQGRIA